MSLSASENSAPRSQRPRGATRFLLTGDVDVHRESRRIAFGLTAVILLALLAFNLAVYQDARGRLVAQGWQRLLTNTDAKRDQAANLLQTFVREARSVAENPDVRAISARMVSGMARESDAAALRRELERARVLFGFTGIRMVDWQGRSRLATAEQPATPPGRDAELAHQALTQGHAVLGDPWGRWLSVAVPVGSGADQSSVLLFHMDGGRLLLPMLREWPGFGPTAGAHLVRQHGNAALVLTPPASACDPPVGSRLPLRDSTYMAAAMAATGVQSAIEARDLHRHEVWVVTRQVPGTSWGLMGRVEANEMLRDLRVTVAGLVVFDLTFLLCVFALAWYWQLQIRGRLAERELQVTERHGRRVQAIFDTAFDAILTFDADGRVQTVNRAAEELFGASAAELENRSFGDLLVSPERPGESLPTQAGTLRAVARRPDGATVPVEASLGVADDGEVTLFTAIVRDVRERDESEQRIRAFAEGLELTNRRLEEVNAQLEEASRLKTEFLANTSHELRTPLNGMIGFLQLVLDGLCDSPEEERDFLRQALQCSRHLLGLINDVLDIAKIESGKLTLEVGPLDLKNLFDEAHTITHVQAGQRGLDLKFVNEVGPGVRARGDFAKAKQVLVNLIGNSLKFTPTGSIVVRARSRQELGHVIIEVEDTGIGIPLDRQRVIFEKFVQADGSTTRKYGGTGLGLAITKSLVELMGGIIGVQSEGEGRGTRVYFSLPVWRDDEMDAPDDARPALSELPQGPATGALALVVEDDPVFRRFLVTVLNQSGWRTLEADDAEKGWVLVRRHLPAVVVLDYALSCGDNAGLRTGWDLAQRMTGDPRTRHVPVVFVTGFDGEVVQRIRETAFARKPEHLRKPVEARDLVAKLESMASEVRDRVVRVLVADDDPTVHTYVGKVLPADRFHVEFAHDGEECLHLLRTRGSSYDALVLDLMMPRVSGYDVLREMTLVGVARDLPVLVLTNFAEPRNEEEARLLRQGVIIEVVAKTEVHARPQRLAEVLDAHLHSLGERGEDDESREAA